MTSSRRYFTPEEAEDVLPRVKDLMMLARRAKGRIEEKIDEWRRTRETMSAAEEAIVKGQVDFLAEGLEEKLNEIAELGAFPKDIDKGLVDFPARIFGKEGYLCWKFGEDKIQYWHGLTEGYQGRQKLPQPQEAQK